jgi:hypothetical protein
MRALRRAGTALALAIATLAVSTSPAHAQGRGKAKHYAVSSDRALSATRVVLERQGFEVVRVVRSSDAQVVYYRAGNKGKGKGPMERMVIRTVERRVVFEEVPDRLLVDIDVQLKL